MLISVDFWKSMYGYAMDSWTRVNIVRSCPVRLPAAHDWNTTSASRLVIIKALN